MGIAIRFLVVTVLVVAGYLGWAREGLALDRTWIGGNLDWIDAGTDANWNPNDEPDTNDRAIFNTPNTVNLGSDNTINGLSLSGGIDLLINNFALLVDGPVDVAGANTNFVIGDSLGVVSADDVTINSASVVELRQGSLRLDEEIGTSLVTINAGGTLQGHGTVSFLDVPVGATTMLVNNGTLAALSRGLTIVSPPPVRTLRISDVGSNGRIDLDGATEVGVVNVNRNQTLDIEMTLLDTFNGTLNLFHNSTFESDNPWTLGVGGSIIANNGFVAGVLPNPDIPADVSFIRGGSFGQSGGVINVTDTDGTLQIVSAFSMIGGSFTNSGTVIFGGTVNITTAVGYDPVDVNSQTIFEADATINDPAGNFNWDGNGAADTTVNNGSLLAITVNQVDTGDNVFGGDIILNDASDVSVNVAASSWTLAGRLTKNDAGTSSVSGDRIVITGQVRANTGTLDLPAVTTSNTANFDVTGVLTLGGNSELAGGTVSGSGLLRMDGTSTVAANTTIGVSTFDWDGLGTGTSHTINSGVILTINSAAMDSDGDMDDPVNLAGNGSQLIVNNTNGLAQWTQIGTFNANNAASGTSTIGGTSRVVFTNTLNINGNTNISAPVTFDGINFFADIDAGATLDVTSSSAIYQEGTIDGAGTFSPGSSNTISGNFTINSAGFDFDGGTWVIENGSKFVFNVSDYDLSPTNAFGSTMTLNNGLVFANSPDPLFVMAGTMNMNASGGNGAEWNGDSIQIGDDIGVLNADLNVSGDGNVNSQGRFLAPVVFMSDADVNVAAGGSLVFNRSVTFNSVNAANQAEFTGSGSLSFSDDVIVNEATTLNMVGGTVDLDGNDAVGDTIGIIAPLTIKAKAMASFGRVNVGGGVNILTIDNLTGANSGSLTVNLDEVDAEWTINQEAAVSLSNDNAAATLLAGSDLNLNSDLAVTGDVRVAARLDLGATALVTINTANEPLRLAGGNSSDDTNTINGAVITGAGVLGADDGKALRGFGTINTSVDFDGAANLFADNGTLVINGTITDVGRIGTADADGILNVANAWNTNVANFVQLSGGVIQGGTMTIGNVNRVTGHGTIASRVINNTGITASGGTLVVQTAANDNDWDGAANNASLHANSDATLEIRDVGAAFGFTGVVSTFAGGRVFANGFALDFNPGSSLFLNSSGTYESTSSTDLGGVVTTSAGSPSTIKVTNNSFLTFEPTSNTTLVADLILRNNNINIEAGAIFAGTGALVIPDGSNVVMDANANANVLFINDGGLRPANSEGIGRIDVKDYQQGETGSLFTEIRGTALNQFDRLVVNGVATLDGYLNIDIDGGFVPALGQSFNILSASTGVSGAFDIVDVSGMPAGLAFHVNYLPTIVQLQVVNKPSYAADFDDDGDVDLTDLSIWQGAFNLNQLGDADGDNDSDAADWTIWRDTFGSAPLPPPPPLAASVPEPSSPVMSIAVVALCAGIRRRGRNTRR